MSLYIRLCYAACQAEYLPMQYFHIAALIALLLQCNVTLSEGQGTDFRM